MVRKSHKETVLSTAYVNDKNCLNNPMIEFIKHFVQHLPDMCSYQSTAVLISESTWSSDTNVFYKHKQKSTSVFSLFIRYFYVHYIHM